MAHWLSVALLGGTALLGMALTGFALREVRSPTWLRRAHLAAGAASLVVLLQLVDTAARAIPPLPGASGRLPAGFVACALVLGLSLWLVARYARGSLTILRALHVCMGFCGVILAIAWVLRPGV